MSTDAIVILKEDHKEIRQLFRSFQQLGETEYTRQEDLKQRILELLTVHTFIENECMYPRVRALVPNLEDDILESYEEHHVADLVGAEWEKMSPRDERFRAKATVLIENVTHHMEEEEQDWFPQVRAAIGRKQLQELGREMLELRTKAPRSPAEPGMLQKAADLLLPNSRN